MVNHGTRYTRRSIGILHHQCRRRGLRDKAHRHRFEHFLVVGGDICASCLVWICTYRLGWPVKLLEIIPQQSLDKGKLLAVHILPA